MTRATLMRTAAGSRQVLFGLLSVSLSWSLSLSSLDRVRVRVRVKVRVRVRLQKERDQKKTESVPSFFGLPRLFSIPFLLSLRSSCQKPTMHCGLLYE